MKYSTEETVSNQHIKNELVRLLRQANPHSVLGMGIRYQLFICDDPDELIREIKSLSTECAETMTSVIGEAAMKLLDRYGNTVE